MGSIFRQDVCSSATVPAQQISASDMDIVISDITTDVNYASVTHTVTNPYDEDVDVTVETTDSFGASVTHTYTVLAGSSESATAEFQYDFTGSDESVEFCCTVTDATASSGGGGSTTSMIADFESGSLGSGWEGDTGAYAVQSSVIIEGSYTLEGSGFSFLRNPNLSAPRGASYSHKVRFAEAVEPNAAGPLFCMPAIDSGYAVEALQPGGGLRITRFDSGSTSFLDSTFPLSALPTAETLTIEWTVGSSDITADLYDSTGSNLASVGAVTDTTYTSDVPGIYSNSASLVYHDAYQAI